MKRKIIILTGFLLLAASLIGCSFSRKYTYNFYNDHTLVYTETIKKVEDIVIPENPSKEGYTFKGWAYQDTISDIQSLELANYDFYVSYEINYYTLTIDELSETYAYNTVVTLPTLSQEGYTFKGYQDTNDVIYADRITLKSNMILTSVFEINHYTITIDDKTETYEYGQEVILPALSQEGYTFKGYRDSQGQIYHDSFIVKDNLTLNSYFEINQYTVTIDGEEKSYDYLSVVDLPALQKEGYSFKGYEDANGVMYTDSITVQGDISLTSVFEIIHYTLTFLDEVNQEYSTLSYTVEDTIVLPTFSVKGYTFKGWAYQGTIYSDTLPNNLGDITLTPSLELNTYTITVNETVIEYTICDDKTIELPVLTKENCTFLGYKIDGQGDYYFALESSLLKDLARNFTLIPYFQGNVVYVTFETRGGHTLDTMGVAPGEKLVLPEATKSGVTFVGWYKDYILNEAFEETTIDQDITLYACYSDDTRVRLTYSSNVGDTINCAIASGTSYLTGYRIELRAADYYHNYQFAYWVISNQIVSYDTDVYISGSSDCTIEAYYQSLNYQKYSLNDLSQVQLAYSQAPTALYGSGITSLDYTLSDTILLSESYVASLGEGLFSYYTDKGEYLYLELYYDDVTPCDIRLDYDSCYPSVKLDFYGTGSYTLYVNGTYYGEAYDGMIIEEYDKSKNNTLIIEDTSAIKTTFERAGYTSTSASYYNRSFNLGGKTYDYVIESLEEFYSWLQYEILIEGPTQAQASSIYVSGTYTGKAYIESDVRGFSSKNLITNGLRTFSVPFDMYYSYSLTNHIYSIDMDYASTFNTERTSQTTTTLSLYTLTTYNRGSDYEGFRINDYTKTVEIKNLYALEHLEYGVRPICQEGTREEEVYNAAKEICRTYITDGMTDFQKVKTFYDWIAINVTYDDAVLNVSNQGAYRSHTSYGALIDHCAVCDGISMAFKLLCEIEGIQCIQVVGQGNGGGHAWNKVCIDGCWYAVDCTWARVNDTYISHLFLFMDESYNIQSTHIEMQQGDYPQIYHLATSYKTYYQRTITNSLYNYDLQIDSRSELTSALTYAKNYGLKVLDITSTYYTSEQSLKNALRMAAFGSGVSYTNVIAYGNSSAGYVYYITLR